MKQHKKQFGRRKKGMRKSGKRWRDAPKPIIKPHTGKKHRRKYRNSTCTGEKETVLLSNKIKTEYSQTLND